MNINNSTMRLKKTGRVCQELPWKAASPAPWDLDYIRVVIPFTEAERRNATPGKTCHIQVVRRDSIEIVKGNYLVIN